MSLNFEFPAENRDVMPPTNAPQFIHVVISNVSRWAVKKSNFHLFSVSIAILSDIELCLPI